VTLRAPLQRAAPDLLRICEMAEAAFNMHNFTRDGGVVLPDCFEALLRAALAKAREKP